jgi:hypothetical protein
LLIEKIKIIYLQEKKNKEWKEYRSEKKRVWRQFVMNHIICSINNSNRLSELNQFNNIKSFYWGLKNIFMRSNLNYKCIWFDQEFSYWWIANTNQKKEFLPSVVRLSPMSIFLFISDFIVRCRENYEIRQVFFLSVIMTH